jgi:D-3-phosphoglycerate dehydrogenase
MTRPAEAPDDPQDCLPRRDGIVDEAALYDAPAGGKLAGAGLDVFATEPADPANPLFRLEQVVITPHTAGGVIDLVADIARHAFTNMQSVLRGTPLLPDDVPKDVTVPPPEENK